ncbi:hypothetical protein HYS91_04300 [Candidatus Daviesbacteria bacterium]|nr:hypothetical protein [Candidatus Daviesbacteria bacterium]
MRKIHLILTGLSLTILLLSINRLTNLTQSYLQPYDFLRWLDFNAMIPIPLISVILYYLLKKEIVYDSPFRKTAKYTFLMVLLISGIYFFAAGSGDHEVTNYLNTRFCDNGAINTPACKIIGYNDDEFSHLIYYIGFVLMNVALIFIEYNYPRKILAKTKDLFFIFLNGLFIALGIFANLAFEEIGLDLLFFGSVMVLTHYVLFIKKRKVKQLPVTFYFSISYTIGVMGTILYKSLTGAL